MSSLKERNFDGYLIEPRGTNTPRPPRSEVDFMTPRELREFDQKWQEECIAKLGSKGDYHCRNCGAYHREEPKED